jgi:hypothetical protein
LGSWERCWHRFRTGTKDVIALSSLGVVLANWNALAFDFGQEFRTGKAVLSGMNEKRSCKPFVQPPTRDFLEEEPSTGLEDTNNFPYSLLPVRNVVQSGKIHDGIESCILEFQASNIGDLNADSITEIAG